MVKPACHFTYFLQEEIRPLSVRSTQSNKSIHIYQWLLEGHANPHILIYRDLQDPINAHFRLKEHLQAFTCSTGQIQTTTLLHLTRFYRVVLYLVSVPISRFTGCLHCRSNLVLQVIYSVEMQYLYAIRMTGCWPRCLRVFFTLFVLSTKFSQYFLTDQPTTFSL